MLGIPKVRQATEATCGPAALLAVARYWLGDKAPSNEKSLYGRTKLDKNIGVEPTNIAKAARSLGLHALVLRGLPIDYYASRARYGVPSILLMQAYAKAGTDYETSWDAGHYVVFAGRELGRLVFMDPGAGDYAKLTRAELYTRWRGYDAGKKTNATAVVVEGTSPLGQLAVRGMTTRSIP